MLENIGMISEIAKTFFTFLERIMQIKTMIRIGSNRYKGIGKTWLIVGIRNTNNNTKKSVSKT
jgi:hypothetical protein